MHTNKGPKILENNSRPGDPEILNLLPILKDDFIDICFKMLDGSLTRVNLEEKATVATYKVPPNYGGFKDVFPQQVEWDDINKPVDMNASYALTKKYRDNIRVYPASMELRNKETYALTSRTVCIVGIENDIESARKISLEGVQAIKGGALWHRTDIASKEHIARSVEHIRRLRSQK
jgi:phosphoribosylamine--glycine ligase